MEMRRCTKCGTSKPLNGDNFSHTNSSRRKEGDPVTYRYQCRVCQRAYVSEHSRNNRDQVVRRAATRALRVQEAGAELSPSERREIKALLLSRQKNRCFYCGVAIDESSHLDHMTPVVQGGSSNISNLAMACSRCNDAKHGKNVDEFRIWLRKNRIEFGK
jgi:5-methylcytosine-specific restriction endonuclease McrA